MALTDTLYAPQVLAAAARLEPLAAAVRARAMRLAVASGDDRWDGDGAREFRRRAHELAAELHRAGDELDAAVAALRRHGTVVADRQAAQLETQRRAMGALVTLARGLR